MTALADLAAQFHDAFRHKTWRGDRFDPAELTIPNAYEVQRLVAQARVETGESIVGYKVGCTSPAIQTQFGLHEPICGRLFHPHVQSEGTSFDRTAYANCAIEPEMAIRIGRDLESADPTDAELIAAMAYICPAIELHDYTFWLGHPSLQELICSGGIHAGLIIGRARADPAALRFRDETFAVFEDGDLRTSAPASEVMGSPLHSLRWLVNFLLRRGETLKAGSWVIPGSPTELIEIGRDLTLKVVIDRVGEVVAEFRGS